MTKRQIIFLFTAAGLILAAVLGVYFYRSNLGSHEEEIISLLQDFIGKIAAGDIKAARELMSEETRNLLRDPGTILGETIYRKLELKSIGSIYSEGNGNYSADVVLSVPDTLKIMTKAGIIFAESVTEKGPSEDPDQTMSDIYTEILLRDDIPMIDNFCIIRMETRDGRIFISGNTALQQVLEGNTNQSSSFLDQISGIDDTGMFIQTQE